MAGAGRQGCQRGAGLMKSDASSASLRCRKPFPSRSLNSMLRSASAIFTSRITTIAQHIVLNRSARLLLTHVATGPTAPTISI